MTSIRDSVFLLFKLVPNNLVLPIIRGPLRGSKWISGATPGRAKGLSVIANMSEKNQIDQVMKFLKKSSICFDVGANVGIYTLLFAKYSKRVYSFEPLPRNLSYLKRTIQINKIMNAHVVPKAMADKTEHMQFQESDCNSMGKLSINGGLTVHSVTCDDFVDDNEKPSVIKIDVEGGESAVLRGAMKTLSTCKPTILLSTHSDFQKKVCLETLRRIGYTVVPIEKRTVIDASEFLAFARK